MLHFQSNTRTMEEQAPTPKGRPPMVRKQQSNNEDKKKQFWDEVEEVPPVRQQPKPRAQNKYKFSNPDDHDDVPAFAQGIPKNVQFNIYIFAQPVQEFDDDFDEANLIDCPEGCGRRFSTEAIDKHSMVCRKVFQQKRKKFDTKKQRVVEGEGQVTTQKPRKEPKTKKNQWKQQSEAFRALMKMNKGYEMSESEKV